MCKELLKFLDGKECFIEAEAKPDKMNAFLSEYNASHGEAVSDSSDGIRILSGSVDKWGVELRLYVSECSEAERNQLGFRHHPRSYRAEYPYRLDDNDAVRYLLKKGYRIGYNG